MKIVLFLLGGILLTSCSTKIIARNCEPTESQQYYVCDSLSLLGK